MTTPTFVLLGQNIGHSLSPRLQNVLFREHGLPYRYELLPVAPLDFEKVFQQIARGSYRGANITSPFKETVIPLIDLLSDDARAINAVNTVVFDGGKTAGYNTDVTGFAWSLRDQPVLETPFTAAVIGTGGAARAAVQVLLNRETLSTVTIYSRSRARADSVARIWGDSRVRSETIESFHTADVIVHATPIGLPGNPGSLLRPDQLIGAQLLYEMIYSPGRTTLIQDAERVGVRTLGGLAMFVAQAAESFRLWTGIEVAPERLQHIIEREH